MADDAEGTTDWWLEYFFEIEEIEAGYFLIEFSEIDIDELDSFYDLLDL